MGFRDAGAWMQSPTPKRATARLAALFAFGWLALTYPLLGIFAQPHMIGGIPVLYAYIFAVWLVVIVLLALAHRSPGP